MPNTIAENLQRLVAARTAISNAIITKGGTVNAGDGLEEFPNDINTIPTTNLTALNVTENGTYYESTPEEITSTSFPITLSNSLGTNLIDYLISGNMSQTGTPTPTTPIQPQEAGERTCNLFPFDDKNFVITAGNSNLTVECKNGNLFFQGNAGEISSNQVVWKNNFAFELEAGTYYCNFPAPLGHGFGRYIKKYDDNTTILTSTNYTFTLSEKTKCYLSFYIYQKTLDTKIELMLNSGSTAVPYEPYGIKIPISSANTTTPIYLGEVETTRRIKKSTVSITNIITLSNGNKAGVFSFPDSSKYAIEQYGLCDISKYDIARRTSGMFYVNRQNAIFIGNSNDTLGTLKAIYDGCTLWYVLETPTTGIVNEPIRKIGDYADTLSYEQAGVQIPTLHGNTVIDVETELKPSQMYIKYDQPSEYAGYSIVNVNVPIPTKYVTEITITENIIEDNMFKNYTALETAILPNNLTTIGIGSFENCTSLTLTTLPDTVTTINDNAFNNCTSLSLTTLPTSLITIGNNAFFGTAMAGEIHIPNTVTTIGDNIFSNTGITDIIFDGTPTTINSNAFSNMNSLETIYVPWAEGTVTGAPWGAGSNVTILYVNTNWHDIREVVRKGKAQQFYPLGTVLYDDFDSTNINRTAYEVVAYNHFNDSSLSAQGYVDSMTLCEKYVRYGVAVDATEALMVVTTELPAGTYKFTIPNYDAAYGGNKTYYFVLNNSVPVGGQLVLNWPYQAVPITITTYASSTATTSIESYGTAASPLPEWVEGTSPEAIDLGTVTMSATATTNTYGIFNHIHRARHGSNNYAQSGIRQYMNATTTNWWTPQTIFDRRHSLNSSTGILGTLNTDFVNVLATPSITNIANNTFEYQSLNGDTFTLNTEYTINTDKLFLLSHSEVNLSATPTLGTVLDYYIDADNNKRIKYDRTNNSTAHYWWFRTPNPTNASYVRNCNTSGALNNNIAIHGNGCVPACIIQ